MKYKDFKAQRGFLLAVFLLPRHPPQVTTYKGSTSGVLPPDHAMGLPVEAGLTSEGNKAWRSHEICCDQDYTGIKFVSKEEGHPLGTATFASHTHRSIKHSIGKQTDEYESITSQS